MAKATWGFKSAGYSSARLPESGRVIQLGIKSDQVSAVKDRHCTLDLTDEEAGELIETLARWLGSPDTHRERFLFDAGDRKKRAAAKLREIADKIEEKT